MVFLTYLMSAFMRWCTAGVVLGCEEVKDSGGIGTTL